MRLSKTQAESLCLMMFCFGAVFVAGCASGTKSVGGKSGPVTLLLKGQSGQEDVTRYFSNSRIKDYEGKQLIRDRDEAVEFRVSETVSKVDSKTGNPTVLTTTTFKDGTVDLHDLAFPEKGEEIEYVFSREGQVIKAGVYPEDSVFFVPPLPLPKGPVNIGDTWTMDHAWVGLKNGIPLSVHMIGILKDIKSCGPGQCADIEVSGNVEVIGMAPQQARFTSALWGRMLFAIDRGAVIWSEVRSRENMIVGDNKTDVLSCMVAELEVPKAWRVSGVKQECKPTLDQIAKTP